MCEAVGPPHGSGGDGGDQSHAGEKHSISSPNREALQEVGAGESAHSAELLNWVRGPGVPGMNYSDCHGGVGRMCGAIPLAVIRIRVGIGEWAVSSTRHTMLTLTIDCPHQEKSLLCPPEECRDHPGTE